MENTIESENTQPKISIQSLKKYLVIAFLVLLCAWVALFSVRYTKLSKAVMATPLTMEATQDLENLIKSTYSTNYQNLKPLPYNLVPMNLDIVSESAILIDTSNGCILYEKNADKIIPPASMTKLFCMYVVFEEIAKGNLSFDQLINIPPEAWACNMPPHSSLMFLGKGHVVTTDELLKGMSICSGNDASYALAYATSGSMEAFIQKMNSLAVKFNLPDTHFVESSGYSELNTTTARQMADFSRHYVNFYPDALNKYHSIDSFTYPKKENMAPGDVYKAQDWSKGLPEVITMGITQKNTNPLLGRMEGVDGLKTGYIDESGYNLSLTCMRDGTRFLSVTMGGPGKNAREGNEGRVHDGTEMMEWAFTAFKDYTDMSAIKPYFVRVFGGKETGFNIVPAYKPESITVPFIYGENVSESVSAVKVKVDFPQNLKAEFTKGDEIGKITYSLNNVALQTIPLVADRTVEKKSGLIRLTDGLIYSILNKKD